MYMYCKNVYTEVYLQYMGPGMSMLKKSLEFGIIFKGGYRRGIYVLIKTLNLKMSGGKKFIY